MAGKERPLHELVPVERQGKAFVWRGGRWVYLGKWEEEGPSESAVQRLAEYKELWKTDPKALAKPKSDLLFIELWRAWEQSEEGPGANGRDMFLRVERNLFGTRSQPGAYASFTVEQFTARDLRQWQTMLCGLKVKTGKAKGSLLLSRWTVGQCVRMLRRCFAWGVVEGMVDQLHAASLTLVAAPAAGKVKESQKRASIDRASADKAVAFLSPPLQSVIRLLWLTTARPSEVLGLRVEDIRCSGAILLRGGGTLDLGAECVWAAVLDEHKTAGKGFERVLFFGPKSQALLTPHLAGTGYIFKPSEGRAFQLAEQARRQTTTGAGSKKPVKGAKGARRPGAFYTSHALGKAVAKACKRGRVPHWFPYQIRATASAAVMDSHGIEAAGTYMGHKPRGVTSGYTGLNLRLAAKVARECG